MAALASTDDTDIDTDTEELDEPEDTLLCRGGTITTTVSSLLLVLVSVVVVVVVVVMMN